MKTYVSQCKTQTTAGILIVDINRQMVCLNRRFINIWGLPQHLVASRDEKKAIEFIAAQFDNPKKYLKEVQEIYINQLEVHDTIQLKDDRRFERLSLPQYFQSKIVGRIWSFRQLREFDYLKELAKRENKSLSFPYFYS